MLLLFCDWRMYPHYPNYFQWKVIHVGLPPSFRYTFDGWSLNPLFFCEVWTFFTLKNCISMINEFFFLFYISSLPGQLQWEGNRVGIYFPRNFHSFRWYITERSGFSGAGFWQEVSIILTQHPSSSIVMIHVDVYIISKYMCSIYRRKTYIFASAGRVALRLKPCGGYKCKDSSLLNPFNMNVQILILFTVCRSMCVHVICILVLLHEIYQVVVLSIK